MKTDYILRCLIVLCSILMSPNRRSRCFSKLALFSTIFLSISTLKIYINDQTEISVCILPINIDSKALVKEPAI